MGSLLALIYTLPFGLITTEVLVPTLRPISQAQKIHQARSRLASVPSLVSTSRITRETWTLNTPLNPKEIGRASCRKECRSRGESDHEKKKRENRARAMKKVRGAVRRTGSLESSMGDAVIMD